VKCAAAEYICKKKINKIKLCKSIDSRIDSNEAMARDPIHEENIVTAWTPDLFGPIFKKHSLTLKQVRTEFSTLCLFVPFSPI